MAIDIRTDTHLLLVTISETLTREKAIAVQKKAASVVSDGQIRGFLLDVRHGSLEGSAFDFFELTVAHAKTFPPGMKFAVVLSPEDASQTNVKFLQNVASNRCIPMRIFENMKAAEQWLLGT